MTRAPIPNSPPGKQPPIGIDLGTTYSVVACLDSEGRPTTITNRSGDLLTPSALFCDDEGIVVGKEAVRSSTLGPDCYAECFKRDMGSPCARAKLRNLAVPPEVLSAFVLESLRRDAERRVGPVEQVVITVPAFFDEARRRATQEAGRLAHLDVLDIINEPTAAALAYGHQQGFLHLQEPGAAGRMRALVYDLGGGTFDVTILEIEGARFRALATDGDVLLGGRDFDQRLVNHLAEEFIKRHGVDPRSDPQDAAQLWLTAQELKHALSERSKSTAICFHAGLRLRVDVTRAEFEALIQDLVERTETTTALVIKQAGLEWPDIDRVLLVGGSSRIPLVADMLRRVTGKQPDQSQSPDEAVAHGAALYAGMLMEQKITSALPAYQLVNVNSHSLGVIGMHARTRQRVNVPLIPKNTPLPHRAARTFRTADAGQRQVVVNVVEGESERPDACIALGQCVIADLPAGLPKGTPVEVEYAYASNGRLSVHARVPSVRYSRHVEIQREVGRNLGDLEDWRNKLRGLPPEAVPSFAQSAGASEDASDRTTLRKKLDALHVSVGRAALQTPLPDALSRSRAAAAAALDQCLAAQAVHKKAEQARQSASGASVIPLDARLSEAKTQLHAAQVQCDFALLVLGRDCLQHDLRPPAAAREIREILGLQKQLTERD